MVNQADTTYTIDFVGGAAIEGEDLSIIANGTGLIPDSSGAGASIQVSASVLDIVQSVTVAPTAGSVPVTIGNNLGTITIAPGESAAVLDAALISAIDATNLIVSASGVPVGPNDVQVALADNTYYVLYQGLLRGTIGDEFLLSVPPVSTVAVEASNSVNVSLGAIGGTYTIVTPAGPTYELAWNASASAVQAALDSLLSSTTISVTAQAGGFAITNLPTGVAAGLSIDYSQLDAPVVITLQGQGIAYNNVTTLNLDLDPYDNVVNVQGTTAVTNIFGHGGDEQFYVSSLANENLQTAQSADFLLGNLAGIQGDLNLAAGNGVHKLYISNEGSVSGVTAGFITSNTSSNPNALPGTEIEVDGFAPAPIDYQAGPDGIFAGGITYWTGYGTANVTVDAIFQRAGITDSSGDLLRTITNLNTGLGTHDITVNLNGTPAQGGLFVLNTQGPFSQYPTYTNTSTVNASGSSLPLIIFGGQGSSNITGGSGSDIIFGHRGQVVYDNNQGQPVTILGNGGPGDLNNGVDLPPSLIYTIDPTVTGTDTIVAGPFTASSPVTPTPSGGAVYGAGAPADSNIVFGEGGGSITGGLGNDIILGGFGTISLTDGNVSSIQSTNSTSGGNQVIQGGAGSDILIGGPGNNTITGGLANSVIIGSAGSIQLSSGRVTSVTTTSAAVGGNDTITGGPGNDIILGSAGSDNITGGSGNDVILGHDGTVTVANGLPATITSGDPDVGTSATITGGSGNDIILGGIGNDTITGGSGNDIVIGHDGSVQLSGGVVTRASSSQPGNGGTDTIVVGNGTNLVMGGSGKDTITAGSGFDVLLGANGSASFANGVITGVESTNLTSGGNDTIHGGTGTDVMIGGPGNNTITTAGTRDYVVGSDGSATFSDGEIVTLATNDETVGGAETITGGNGSDVIIGGVGASTITGGNGDNLIIGHDGSVIFAEGEPTAAATDPTAGGKDTITVGTGNNLVMGGTGNNTISVTSASSTTRSNSGSGTPVGSSSVDVLMGANGSADLSSWVVTSVTSAHDTDGGNNTITGGAGYNTIIGGPGNNHLTGAGQSDVIVGADGSATYSTSGQITGVNTSVAPSVGGTDTITGGNGSEVILGGAGSVTITGGSGNDVIIGHNGSVEFSQGKATSALTTSPSDGDTAQITAGSGNTLIMAGTGTNNTITGGSGNDVLVGSDASADLSSGAVTSITVVDVSYGGTGTITGGTGNDLIIAGPHAYKITTAGQHDVVVGGDASATFTAGQVTGVTTIDPSYGGNDTITGGSGKDVLMGGAGSDTITSGTGATLVLGHGGTVSLSNGLPVSASTNSTAAGADTITVGTGSDVVLGGSGDNTIRVADGTSADEVLLGANGSVVFSTSAAVTSIESDDPEDGGNNTITGGSGYNVIVGGGPGNNTLTGGSGSDVILGANGSVTTSGGASSIFSGMTAVSTNAGTGGTEDITGGSGHEVLIAGPGAATITGGSGTDLIFGGDAQVVLSGSTVSSYKSTDIGSTGGGKDTIYAESGNARVYGGPGNDIIYGGSGTDYLNGGDTVVDGASGYDQIVSATSSDTLAFDFAQGVPASVSHPSFAFLITTDFTTGVPAAFTSTSGSWSLSGGLYQGTSTGSTPALSLYTSTGTESSFEELQATVQTTKESGLAYDYTSSSSFKFVAIDSQTGQVILGHETASGPVTDATVSKSINSGTSYILALTLNDATATAYLNGSAINLSETYSSSLADGQVGFFTLSSTGKFTDFAFDGTETGVEPSDLIGGAAAVAATVEGPATASASDASASSVAPLVVGTTTTATEPVAGRAPYLARDLGRAIGRAIARDRAHPRHDHSWHLDKGARTGATHARARRAAGTRHGRGD